MDDDIELNITGFVGNGDDKGADAGVGAAYKSFAGSSQQSLFTSRKRPQGGSRRKPFNRKRLKEAQERKRYPNLSQDRKRSSSSAKEDKPESTTTTPAAQAAASDRECRKENEAGVTNVEKRAHTVGAADSQKGRRDAAFRKPRTEKVEKVERVEREAPKELPRIYSHAQATTAGGGKAGKPAATEDFEDEELNSDIDEEGKAFLDQLVSQHFASSEAEDPSKQAAEAQLALNGGDAKNFSELGLDQAVVKRLQDMGYEEPTSIQKSAIPLVLSGKDVLAQSPTGSGKTISYVVPIVNLLKQRAVRVNRSEGALAIIVVPTRELSLQVFQVASRLLKDFYWIVPGTIMGGEKRTREKARLRKGINVLTCTPGRLLDHLENTTAFQVSDLKYLILDEADRLIDMGFEEQVSKIIKLLDEKSEGGDRSSRRQTIMLSATMHSGVSQLAKYSLHEPVSVGFDGTSEENSFQMPKHLKQYYILVPTKLRPLILYKLIKKGFDANRECKMVVFVSCCDSVEFHLQVLNELSASDDKGSVFKPQDAFKLHGNMSQQERTQVYFDFCKSPSAILICTDVAARGLDFPSVTHIIQYDPPGEAEDYIHRVGRTARMQSKGEAYLMLLPSEMPYVDVLRNHGIDMQEELVGQFLSEENRTKNLVLLRKVNSLFRDPVFQKFQRILFEIVAGSNALHQLAANAYRSFLRAYAGYPRALKTIFNVRELHIGHVADSFGLKEKPSLIGGGRRKKK